MAAIPGERRININGHWWIDVSNVTTTGLIYSRRDVEACGGQIPWIVSCVSSDYLPKPNRHERRASLKRKPTAPQNERDS